MSDDEPQEHWLYLLHYNGCCRVVGEDDNWTTAHQMTGDTGRLFAAAPELLRCLKAIVEDLGAEVTASNPLWPRSGAMIDAARAAIARTEWRGD